jgi:hypothetical protein
MQRGARIAGGVLVLAAVALGWWLARGDAPAPPSDSAGPPMPAEPLAAAAPPASAEQPPDAAVAATTAEPLAIAPAHRIAEGGRLSLPVSDLPHNGSFALALDLPDAARGSNARPVRIVSEDGSRTLELDAAPLAGSETGVALLIDPSWLTPDRYLIEVTTAETTHFPLRRYVLEVR